MNVDQVTDLVTSLSSVTHTVADLTGTGHWYAAGHVGMPGRWYMSVY